MIAVVENGQLLSVVLELGINNDDVHVVLLRLLCAEAYDTLFLPSLCVTVYSYSSLGPLKD